jgi:hypothetical protein
LLIALDENTSWESRISTEASEILSTPIKEERKESEEEVEERQIMIKEYGE